MRHFKGTVEKLCSVEQVGLWAEPGLGAESGSWSQPGERGLRPAGSLEPGPAPPHAAPGMQKGDMGLGLLPGGPLLTPEGADPREEGALARDR